MPSLLTGMFITLPCAIKGQVAFGLGALGYKKRLL